MPFGALRFIRSSNKKRLTYCFYSYDTSFLTVEIRVFMTAVFSFYLRVAYNVSISMTRESRRIYSECIIQ